MADLDSTLAEAYERLVAAIENGLASEATAAVKGFLAHASEDPDAIWELAAELADAQDRLDDLWPGLDDDSANDRHDLLTRLLGVLADAWPDEPDFAFTHWDLGRLAVREGDDETARARFERALELGQDPALRASVHLSAGWLGWDHDDFHAATQHARDALAQQSIDAATRTEATVLLMAALRHGGFRRESAEHAWRWINEPGPRTGDFADVALEESFLSVAGWVAQQESLGPVDPEWIDAFSWFLDHPSALPDEFSRADLAVAVAWLREQTETGSGLSLFASVDPAELTDAGSRTRHRLLGVLYAGLRGDLASARGQLAEAGRHLRQADDEALRRVFPVVARMFDMDSGQENPIASLMDKAGMGTTFAEGMDLVGLMMTRAAAQQELTSGEVARVAAWAAELPDPAGGEHVLPLALGAAMCVQVDPSVAPRLAQRARSALVANPQPSVLAPLLETLVTIAEAGQAAITDPALIADRVLAIWEGGEGDSVVAAVGAQISGIVVAKWNPRRCLELILPTLGPMRQLIVSTMGSSERARLVRTLGLSLSAAVRAAERLGQPELLAELLEYSRAQELPLVSGDLDPTNVPLSYHIAELVRLGSAPDFFAATSAAPPASLADAVGMRTPRPILMPWGSVALSEHVAQTGTPIDLVVPRPLL